MRVSNPKCELDESMESCPSYKRVRQMQIHIFGILVSEMIKYKYDIITKCLVISPKIKPNERGVRRMPSHDPNANAYDGFA